jgi:quinol monooxygenase YgiN
MFFVTFKLQSKSNNNVEIIQTLQGIADKVRKIEGCTNVHVYRDIQDESIFFLVEEWQKQRDLEEHAKSDLFAALGGTKGLLVKSPEINFLVEN